MKLKMKLLLGAALVCGLGSNAVFTPKSVEKQEIMSETTCFEECISASATQKGMQTRAKSAYLMDYHTKTVMFSQNERERLPIASMCKIMTLLLSFEAIDAGKLSIDEEIRVSERAASMGGSQVFLEANASYPVKELIKSIVVCSANDSCVAMAEKIAGSESLFVEKMNEKAKEIGANDTLFANCTGLPKDPQYSCAKDVALILQSLLQHEEYYEYSKVWMDKFAHPKGRYTEITNTNKLVRFYDGCDGGKTGFTNEAGFCLAATAERNQMRVISVVIGEETSANRFEDVRTMFDYAFANYTMTPVVEANTPLSECVDVRGGKEKQVAVCPARSAYVFGKRGEKADVSIEAYFDRVQAPIEKGEKVGELVVFQDGVEKDRVPLVSAESVEKANLFDCLRDIARNWNSRGK